MHKQYSTSGKLTSPVTFISDKAQATILTGIPDANRGGADAGKHFYFRDHLGSVREMADALGTVRARFAYDFYGSRTQIEGDLSCEIVFTGHPVHEPTQLVLAPFRAYDPATARWLSRDPIQESGGINLYQYVTNNPVNLWEPLGLEVAVKTRTFFGGLANHLWVDVTKSCGSVSRFSGTNEPGRLLGVLEDYENDVNPVNPAQSIIIPPPKGMTSDEWDNAVIESGRQELQKHLGRKYDPLGGDGGKASGNCHTVTSNIIEGACGKIPRFNPDGANPGLRVGSPNTRRRRR